MVGDDSSDEIKSALIDFNGQTVSISAKLKYTQINTENDEMKYQPEDILTIEDVWLLLDYITNLQEENERLKEITEINNDEEYIYTYEELQDKVLKLQKENKRLNKQYDLMEQSLDEKQAVIDKAIELIHKAMLDSEIIGNGTLNLNDLLNILGGDKNE